VPLERACW